MDKAALLHALSLSGWNRDRAASSLGISRATFYRQMKAHQVSLPKPQTRLTLIEVRSIRKLSSQGLTQSQIADQFGVHRTTIGAAIRGITFKRQG